MTTVRQIAENIILREGGYVNDPDDPGGATNFGVTIGTMKRLGMDLNNDGVINSRDVKVLTKKQATDIFLKYYFKKPQISLLPTALQASVFDMYVNAGGNAIKILQRLCRDLGKEVTVDGALGPKTAKVIKGLYLKMKMELVDAYGIARRNYYYRLADRRKASRKYARTRSGGKGGWIKRAEEFISPKYHLTLQQHQERTASWD